MRGTLATFAFAASTLVQARPQGVTSAVAPKASAPAGCEASREGPFQITTIKTTANAKRDLETRQQSGILTLTLENGILKDQAGRTGYIASNHQFQFDSPPQAGALYTAGFSACGNGSIALGGSTVWYQCFSGGFYNLYDRNWAPQCSPINIVALSGTSGGSASQLPDGQPQAPTAQPCIPVTQIGDGQPQNPQGGSNTALPYCTAAAPVSQISDGQPQAPTPVPVSQISDGQPVVNTVAPYDTVINTVAPAATSAPVSQITDGQPQAPATTASAATPTENAPASAAPSATTAEFTGAAAIPRKAVGGVLAGVVGVVALL